METVDYIWMNGEFIPWDDAKTHIINHSLHYGSAIFEGVRFYEAENGKVAVFRLKEHMDRLIFSSNVMEMGVKYTADEFSDATVETIRKNNLKKGYIRPIIYYGYGKMGLNPHGADVDSVIAVWPWGSYLGSDLVRIKTSKYMRIHPKSSNMKAKISGHYANSILASLEIKKAGFDEALLLDFEGNVAEGPGENIFMVINGDLYTPPEGTILPGLTRNSIMEIAKDNGIKVIEKTITPDELKNADELFFTGTAAEVTGIKQVDDAIIGNSEMGPVTTKLKSIFTDAIHGKIDKYSDWLTYV